MIIPYSIDLIKIQKTNKNNSSEWKIPLNMSVKFITSNDTRKIRTVYVWSDNEEIRSGNDTYDTITGLLNSFLTNFRLKRHY